MPVGLILLLKSFPETRKVIEVFQIQIQLKSYIAKYSDSVTAGNDSTRVTIFGDSNSTRVTLRRMVTRLE